MIIKGQAFSPSYDLAPPQPPVSKFSCVSPVELTDEWRGGGGAKAYDHEDAWLSPV
jgi:hypothetical protein